MKKIEVLLIVSVLMAPTLEAAFGRFIAKVRRPFAALLAVGVSTGAVGATNAPVDKESTPIKLSDTQEAVVVHGVKDEKGEPKAIVVRYWEYRLFTALFLAELKLDKSTSQEGIDEWHEKALSEESCAKIVGVPAVNEKGVLEVPIKFSKEKCCLTRSNVSSGMFRSKLHGVDVSCRMPSGRFLATRFFEVGDVTVGSDGPSIVGSLYPSQL